MRGIWRFTKEHLNFYRVHLLFLCVPSEFTALSVLIFFSTFTPLIFSGILFASNGRFPIDYIDGLFISVSSICVCGLVTVDLSQLTVWQQVLLFIQMCLGSPVRVTVNGVSFTVRGSNTGGYLLVYGLYKKVCPL
jgi:hypothetical protein